MKTAVEDLAYYKANAEQDYLQVPISVLRYISELEKYKELEKEQLRKCYHFAQVEQQKEFSSIYVGMSFEKWYNEIYKNE